MSQPRAFVLQYQRLELRLLPATLTLGRERGCDIRLDDPSVSRQHARLRVTVDAVWLEDLGSRNGVFVNGSRLTPAGRRLLPGDAFYIGAHRFNLQDPGGDDLAKETMALGRPIAATSADVEWARPGSITAVHNDPTRPMSISAQAILADVVRPVELRFADAMRVIKDLVASGADDQACTLLREALDVLAREPPRPALSPIVVATVRALITRWGQRGAPDLGLAERLELLQRWESV